MGNETSSRKLFEKLDTDGDGDLALDELLEHAQQIPGLDENLLQLMKSPLLLFQFDDGEDGVLDRDEFSQMMRTLRSMSRERKKNKRDEERSKRRDKDVTSNHRRRKESKGATKDHHHHHHHHRKGTDKRSHASGSPDSDYSSSKCWTALDSESAKSFHFSRDGATPSVTGHRRRLSSSSSSSTSEEDMSEEARAFLLRILGRKEHRKRFMRWLFRLTDVDNDNDIGPEELNKLLEGLQVDGVDPLFYERADPRKTRAKQLLDLYDTDGDGLLSRKDFMKLADLIMKQYEAKAQVPHKGERIGEFTLKHKLGKGAYSVVRLGVNRETGEKRAVKIMQRGDMSNTSKIDTEIKAMMMLKHPNIVQLHKVLENETHVFFVMECCGGGTLSNYLEVKSLTEPLARFYIKQLLMALKYCHKRGVCHRDLKVENLLLDNDGNLKLCDLGHAGIYSKGWDLFSTGLVGSMYHIAPEQITGQYYSGVKRDVWSVGVVTYQLLCGQPPFFHQNAQQLISSIQNLDYTFPPHISDDATDLIRHILQVDPDDRPSINEIISHRWFSGEEQTPALVHHIYRLDQWVGLPDSSMKIPFKQVLKICEELNVHVVTQEPKKSHYLHMAKCVYPAKDVTFRLALKRRILDPTAPQGSKPFRYSLPHPDTPVRYFEFLLREGQTWDFSELVLSIRQKFSRWQKTMKPLEDDRAGWKHHRSPSKSGAHPSGGHVVQSRHHLLSGTSSTDETSEAVHLNMEREEIEYSQTEDEEEYPGKPRSVNFGKVSSETKRIESGRKGSSFNRGSHAGELSRSPPKMKHKHAPSVDGHYKSPKLPKTNKAKRKDKGASKVKDGHPKSKDKPTRRTLHYSSTIPASPKTKSGKGRSKEKTLGGSLVTDEEHFDAGKDWTMPRGGKDRKAKQNTQSPPSCRSPSSRRRRDVDKDKIAEHLEMLDDWDIGNMPQIEDELGFTTTDGRGKKEKDVGKRIKKKKASRDEMHISTSWGGDRSPIGVATKEKDVAYKRKKKKKFPSGDWKSAATMDRRRHDVVSGRSGEYKVSSGGGGGGGGGDSKHFEKRKKRSKDSGKEDHQRGGGGGGKSVETPVAGRRKKEREHVQRSSSDSSSQESSSDSSQGARVASDASCSESSDEDHRAKRHVREKRARDHRAREKQRDKELKRNGGGGGKKKQQHSQRELSDEGASQGSTDMGESGGRQRYGRFGSSISSRDRDGGGLAQKRSSPVRGVADDQFDSDGSDGFFFHMEPDVVPESSKRKASGDGKGGRSSRSGNADDGRWRISSIIDPLNQSSDYLSGAASWGSDTEPEVDQ